MRIVIVVLAFLSAAVLCGAPSPVRAGGADLEAGIGNPNLGPPYFGEARDIKGMKPLEEVRIRAQPKGSLLPVFVSTDHDGRFRLQGFLKAINPDTVQFACEKPGYKVVSLTHRRVSKAPTAPTEVECLLEKK